MAKKTKKAKGPEQIDNRDRIEPDLRPLARLISTVKFDSHQTNTHDRRSIEEIKASLAEHGQKKPIYVLRSTMEIKAGNGTTHAAMELGWTYLAMVVSDDAEEMARKYAIRDNRSHQFSEFDVDALVAEVTDLGVSPEVFGWDEQEWTGLTDLNFDVPDGPTMPTYGVSRDEDANMMPDDLGPVSITGDTSSLVNGRLIISYRNDEERDWLSERLGLEIDGKRFVFSVKGIRSNDHPSS